MMLIMPAGRYGCHIQVVRFGDTSVPPSIGSAAPLGLVKPRAPSSIAAALGLGTVGPFNGQGELLEIEA